MGVASWGPRARVPGLGPPPLPGTWSASAQGKDFVFFILFLWPLEMEYLLD